MAKYGSDHIPEMYNFEVQVLPNRQSRGKELQEFLHDIACDRKVGQQQKPRPKAGRQQQLVDTQQPNYWWKTAHKRDWTVSNQR